MAVTSSETADSPQNRPGKPILTGLLAALVLGGLAVAGLALRDGGDGDADLGATLPSVSSVPEPSGTAVDPVAPADAGDIGSSGTDVSNPNDSIATTVGSTLEPDPAPSSAPAAAPASTAVPAAEPSPTAPPTTVAPNTVPATTVPAPTAPATTVPATTVVATTVPVSTGTVEESRATVRGGQIFLEGAVPTAEAGAEIEALAAEVLGPDNVFNNYVVDPAAGDPSLGNITVEDTINFATDSSLVLPASEGLLNQGLALLNLRPAMTITIVGHTDSRGSIESNQELSLRRAESVKQWFVDRGVDPGRLTAEGAGESIGIASNDTAEGRRLNRRIQFFLENILG